MTSGFLAKITATAAATTQLQLGMDIALTWGQVICFGGYPQWWHSILPGKRNIMNGDWRENALPFEKHLLQDGASQRYVAIKD